MAFPILFFIVTFALNFLITALLTPKPELENARPAGLGDFQIPTATEGRVIPVIWGRVLVKGPNVIWYGDFEADPITQNVKTGLFSSETITTGFHYYLGMQMAVCRGQVLGIGFAPFTYSDLEIRCDELSVAVSSTSYSASTGIQSGTFDSPRHFGGSDAEGGISGDYKFYTGKSDQPVSAYLSSVISGQVPAYRGTAHIVLEKCYIGDRPNLAPWSFIVSRYPSNLGFTGGEESVDADCNPMEVLYEILTSTEWGMGLSPSEIDVAMFKAVGLVLHGEGNGFGFLWDREMKVAQIINEIERQVDGFLYLSPTTGLYSFKLARNDYVTGSLEILDESNIIELVSFMRPTWTDTFNQVHVGWSDVRKDYNESYALAQDQANMTIVGAINSTTISFPGCKSESLANSLAWRELRALSLPGAKISLKVDRSQYLIFIGDVRKFSWPALGIVNLIVRVVNVDYGKITDNHIAVDLVQDVYATEGGTFADPEDTNWEEPFLVPEAFLAADQFAIEAPYMVGLQADYQSARLLCMARKSSGAAIRYEMRTRDSSTPGGQSGSYEVLGNVRNGFSSVGTLRAAMLGLENSLPAQGTEDIDVDPLSGESLDDLIGPISADEINSYMIGVAVIEPGTANEEWILIEGAIADSGSGIQLQNVYRGALDSPVVAHALGSRIWFIWGGGLGISDVSVPVSRYWDVKLIPISPTYDLDEGDATAVTEFQTDSIGRLARPLIPTELHINGVRLPATVTTSSDLLFEYTRRNWNSLRVLDQVQGIDTDGTDYVPLASNNVEYNWWLYDLDSTPTPSGRGDAIMNGTVSPAAAASFTILEADILTAVGGPMPSALRIEIETESDIYLDSVGSLSAVVSKDQLVFDFDTA